MVAGATLLAKLLDVMAAGCCENYRTMSGGDTWVVAREAAPFPVSLFIASVCVELRGWLHVCCWVRGLETKKAHVQPQAAAAAAGRSSQFKRGFAQRISAASCLEKLWQVRWGTDTPEKHESSTLGLGLFFRLWNVAAGEVRKGVLRRHKIQVTKSQALLQGVFVFCCAQAQRILKRYGSLRGQFSNVLLFARNHVLSWAGKSCRQPPPCLLGDHFCITWTEGEGEQFSLHSNYFS